MYSKDIGKYLGCGLILFIGIYVVYAIMVKPTESRQEGFTSERKTLDSTLDMLRNQSKNLEGKVRIDKNREVWPDSLVQADYKGWEREFLDYPNYVDYRDVQKNQKNFVFYCSDFQLLNLIDVRPSEKSSYIRSSTEPFNDEMKLDQERIKRWLIHFGLISDDGAWNTIHVSGHGTGGQIQKVIEGTSPYTLVPIHTEHEDHFDALHSNVRKVKLDERVDIS